MTDKELFDAAVSIRDHAWKEFEHKSAAEWRLSFAIWTGMLVSAGAVIAAKPFDRIAEWPWVVVPLFLLLVFAHFLFLRWIQNKLAEIRDVLWAAHARLVRLVDLAPALASATDLPPWPTAPTAKRDPIRQATLWVQLALTLLIGWLLIAVVASKRAG
jgi:hypothetical protein